MTLFNNSSHLCHRSAILENIRWTQTAYAVLCQPHHTDTSSTFIYALIWTKTAYLCDAADTEQRTQSILSKMARWDELLNKVVIFIFFAYKIILVVS